MMRKHPKTPLGRAFVADFLEKLPFVRSWWT